MLSTKMVFSNWPYIAIAAAVAALFWIIFNVFDQLLFFSPVLVFYLPNDAVVGFVISNITAILMGMVVSMNVYLLKHSKKQKLSISSLFSGTSLSVLSSTCVSCSSLGFVLISTFGGVGVTLSTFLTNYQTPLRLISIILLIWAYYSISKKLTEICIVNNMPTEAKYKEE
jgi:hypothetical protein